MPLRAETTVTASKLNIDTNRLQIQISYKSRISASFNAARSVENLIQLKCEEYCKRRRRHVKASWNIVDSIKIHI